MRVHGLRRQPEPHSERLEGDDILRLLGRFGLARRDQIARHTGRRAAAVQRALATLEARGLVRMVAVVAGGVRSEAAALTAAGSRHLPALMSKQRVDARQAASLLAALDLAWQTEAQGGSLWVPWHEAARAGQVLPHPGALPPADGLIVPEAVQRPLGARRGAADPGDPGRARPVCIVLERPTGRALRRRVAAAGRAAGGAPVLVHVLPHLAAEVRQQAEGLLATIIPWEPTAGTRPRAGANDPRAGQPSGRGALTPKRLRALALLAGFGYATVDQVARAQGTHSTAASIMLAAMERAGLVQRHREHHLHKDVYSATAVGLATAALPLPPVPRVPAQRRHALALVDLAHALAAETGGVWETHRELVAHAAGRAAGTEAEAPDGALALPDGRRIAVELELSSQARHAVLAFAGAQLASGRFDEVWYVVAPEWEHRYAGRLASFGPRVRVRAWTPPDRLGGPRGFRSDRVTREPTAPRILGRGRRGEPAARR